MYLGSSCRAQNFDDRRPFQRRRLQVSDGTARLMKCSDSSGSIDVPSVSGYPRQIKVSSLYPRRRQGPLCQIHRPFGPERPHLPASRHAEGSARTGRRHARGRQTGGRWQLSTGPSSKFPSHSYPGGSGAIQSESCLRLDDAVLPRGAPRFAFCSISTSPPSVKHPCQGMLP